MCFCSVYFILFFLLSWSCFLRLRRASPAAMTYSLPRLRRGVMSFSLAIPGESSYVRSIRRPLLTGLSSSSCLYKPPLRLPCNCSYSRSVLFRSVPFSVPVTQSLRLYVQWLFRLISYSDIRVPLLCAISRLDSFLVSIFPLHRLDILPRIPLIDRAERAIASPISSPIRALFVATILPFCHPYYHILIHRTADDNS